MPLPFVVCAMVASLRRVPSLAHVQQFHIEDEGSVFGNHRRRPPGAVAEVRRDDEAALAADLHGDETFIPARNDVADPQREGERLLAFQRAVKLAPTVCEPAGVVHDYRTACRRRLSAARDDVDVLQSACRRYLLPPNFSPPPRGPRPCAARGGVFFFPPSPCPPSPPPPPGGGARPGPSLAPALAGQASE